uniref:Uncharacterized protein n=1 Tax=Populus davidiana TaxID=266767 RepID=A0A6M2EUZ1_9ROSI
MPDHHLFTFLFCLQAKDSPLEIQQCPKLSGSNNSIRDLRLWPFIFYFLQGFSCQAKPVVYSDLFNSLLCITLSLFMFSVFPTCLELLTASLPELSLYVTKPMAWILSFLWSKISHPLRSSLQVQKVPKATANYKMQLRN